MSLFALLDRFEQRMQRALTWWMSAPMDDRAAVALLVLPWVLVAAIVLASPPHH